MAEVRDGKIFHNENKEYSDIVPILHMMIELHSYVTNMILVRDMYIFKHHLQPNVVPEHLVCKDFKCSMQLTLDQHLSTGL